jgi:hypothetical protein
MSRVAVAILATHCHACIAHMARYWSHMNQGNIMGTLTCMLIAFASTWGRYQDYTDFPGFGEQGYAALGCSSQQL